MKKKIGITLAVVVLLVCVISVAVFAGCKEKVTAENAQTATQTNWAEIDNKSAKTTLTISGLSLSLADGDITLSAGAKVDLERTWADGVLTIKVTAQPQNVKVNLGSLDSLVSDILGDYVNFTALNNLKFTGTVEYEYGTPEKTIRVKDMSVSGLRSAIPALTDENITDAAWPIRFASEGGSYVSSVEYDLVNLTTLLSQGAVGGVVSGLFNEGYTLDVLGMIDDLLLNQTLLNFTDSANAAYADGVYTNNVSALDNIDFIMDVWNNLSATGGKGMIAGLLNDMKMGVDDDGNPTGGFAINDKITIDLYSIVKALAPDFNDLLPSLLETIVTDGKMSVEGTVADGVFSELKCTTTGVSINLTEAQVKTITDQGSSIISDLGVSLGGINLDTVISTVAGGKASVSLGTITVNSTFTVA